MKKSPGKKIAPCKYAGLGRAGCTGGAVVKRGGMYLCRSCATATTSATTRSRAPVVEVPKQAADAAALKELGRAVEAVKSARRRLDAAAVAAAAAGWTWGEVGRTVGMTRQSARARWGTPAGAGRG